MTASTCGGRGIILGRRETYNAGELHGLTRADLRLLALDLDIEGAKDWVHPYWNGSGRGRYKRRAVWKLKRAEMIQRIEETITDGIR